MPRWRGRHKRQTRFHRRSSAKTLLLGTDRSLSCAIMLIPQQNTCPIYIYPTQLIGILHEWTSHTCRRWFPHHTVGWNRVLIAGKFVRSRSASATEIIRIGNQWSDHTCACEYRQSLRALERLRLLRPYTPPALQSSENGTGANKYFADREYVLFLTSNKQQAGAAANVQPESSMAAARG